MNKTNFPKHIAFIMDGNRRWAKEHGLGEFEGHRQGENRIKPIIDVAIELGVPYLTFWAFSTENWYRSKREVNFLIHLFRQALEDRVDRIHKSQVKLNIIGDISRFPPDIQKKIRNWMDKTRNNKKITVNMALSYGGRDEIVRAINKLSNQIINKSRSKVDRPLDETNNEELRKQFNNLTIDQFSNFLDTADQPDPDLLIRTGGEMRLSGFLLWQLEYTELYFTETLWPDFTPTEFKKALVVYNRRFRRFGR